MWELSAGRAIRSQSANTAANRCRASCAQEFGWGDACFEVWVDEECAELVGRKGGGDSFGGQAEVTARAQTRRLNE